MINSLPFLKLFSSIITLLLQLKYGLYNAFPNEPSKGLTEQDWDE